jgi:hypothetical protein
LLFERLWEETGCRAVIEALLAGRSFAFAVERAIFATVLHRLFVSGSDRACEKWLEDYAIPGVGDLALHHLYRAMAWLGEELPASEQAAATPFARRCVKDRIEEDLFARRRDLFSALSVVFLEPKATPGGRYTTLASASRARAARASASGAIPRTTGPTSTR